VTKSALEVYVVHDDAIYKLTTFTFTFVSFAAALGRQLCVKIVNECRKM